MKQIPKVVFLILFITGMGLLLWTILPLGRQDEEFSMKSNYSLFPDEPECGSFQDLLDANFLVSYSKTIRYYESDDITVAIEKPNSIATEVNISDEIDLCKISMEVWIEGKDMLIEPGSRIIESIHETKNHTFNFEVTPLTKFSNKGTIWIYTIFPNGEKRLERIPLFAIPFSIRVISIMGISPNVVRIFAFSIMLLSVFFLWLHMDMVKNRK